MFDGRMTEYVSSSGEVYDSNLGRAKFEPPSSGYSKNELFIGILLDYPEDTGNKSTLLYYFEDGCSMLNRNVGCLCTKAHVVISQKTWVSAVTVVRTSNVASVFLFPLQGSYGLISVFSRNAK